MGHRIIFLDGSPLILQQLKRLKNTISIAGMRISLEVGQAARRLFDFDKAILSSDQFSMNC